MEALPTLSIVMEHLARVGFARSEAERATQKALLGMARYPNLYVKIPGLGEFCERAMPVRERFMFVEPIPPLLTRFCDAFGAARLMWGSDYPPVAGREGYGNALRLPMAQLEHRTEEERAAIFGGTALEVFPIRG